MSKVTNFTFSLEPETKMKSNHQNWKARGHIKAGKICFYMLLQTEVRVTVPIIIKRFYYFSGSKGGIIGRSNRMDHRLVQPIPLVNQSVVTRLTPFNSTKIY